jgi:PAS domain S-box-containing protein
MGVSAMDGLDGTRRQFAEELAEFRQRVAESEVFRSLFEDSVVGTVVVTPNGSIVQANKAFCELLGCSESELVGRTVLSITHPDDRDTSSTAIRQAAESVARIQRLEKRYLHKSGQVVWGEVSSTLIRDSDGKPSYFIAQVLDISERKRAEEILKKAHDELETRVEQRTAELREANERLQQEVDERRRVESTLDAFFRMSPVTLSIVDDEFRIIKIDNLTPTYFGLDAQSMIGKSIKELVPDWFEKHGATVECVVKNGETIHNLEVASPVPNRPGEMVYWRTSHFAIPLPGGKWGDGCVAVDITDMKRAEAALQQSHDELQTIYDHAVDGIIIVDAETMNPIRANSAYCRMLDCSGEDVFSLSPERVHPPEVLPVVLDYFDAVRKGSITRIGDLPFLRKDGSVVYADVVSSPIFYNERPCWISFFHDVTERKLAQNALERERQSLWRMLQASDHERRTISYEIHDGIAQYLAAAAMQFEAYDGLIGESPGKAKKAYKTAVELVHQAHSESRRLISEVRPPVIDESGLETAIAHLIHEQRRNTGLKIELHGSLQVNRLPAIMENALYRIVQEALTNACTHSESKSVRVTLAREERDFRLEVRDWGIGFAPEAVEKGHFGLEGIRERVRLLGGRLTIESTPGSGTLVQVVVPILERQAEG